MRIKLLILFAAVGVLAAVVVDLQATQTTITFVASPLPISASFPTPIPPSPLPSPSPSPSPLQDPKIYGPCKNVPVVMYHHVQPQDQALAKNQQNISVDSGTFAL